MNGLVRYRHTGLAILQPQKRAPIEKEGLLLRLVFLNGLPSLGIEEGTGKKERTNEGRREGGSEGRKELFSL